MRFTVLVSKSPNDQGYWAMVPALPGCFSAGDTFEEAQKNVEEAIVLHIEGILEEGGEMPVDEDFIVAHTDISLKPIS